MADLPYETWAAALPSATLPLTTEPMVVVQGGVPKQVPPSAVAAMFDVVTQLAGSVGGSAWCEQQDRSGNKEVVVTLKAWQSTPQDYTFPVPFADYAVALFDSSPVSTVILTKVTLPDTSAGAIDAVIVIRGH